MGADAELVDQRLEQPHVAVAGAARDDQHDRSRRFRHDAPGQDLQQRRQVHLLGWVDAAQGQERDGLVRDLQAATPGGAITDGIEDVVVDAQAQCYQLAREAAAGDGRARLEQPREGVGAVAAETRDAVVRCQARVREAHRVVEDLPAVDREDHAGDRPRPPGVGGAQPGEPRQEGSQPPA